ncbi:hypothetical protein [Neorhizobium tomejilense]|uniref:hypothetical protein n=1 Tax=Neorhizobium tomejilense TaxID=2093828 RepID=UPI00155E436C|nr:hypothetical protein [Neorhizobium tomejilense]
MFRKGTTFVIGAGASAEFGMPVGSELAKRIRGSALIGGAGSPNPIAGDDFFYNSIEQLALLGTDRVKLMDAALTIYNGIHTAVSIDAFIDRFSSDDTIALIGKMLIALEIAKAESESSMSSRYRSRMLESPQEEFYNSYGTKLINPDDTWIGQFLRILCDGVKDPEKLGNNINIICFNYDRCIEYYLCQQIAAAYKLAPADAADIVSGMNIIHPYGTLGQLPVQDGGHGEGILTFGAGRNRGLDLQSVARNIRTYTEQQHDTETITDIHKAIVECHVLVFLGFGFNNQNLDLLRASHLSSLDLLLVKKIYTSGVGIARQVEETLKRRIMHILWNGDDIHKQREGSVHVEYDHTCNELFKTHNMNLSSFTRAYFDETQKGKRQVITSLFSD